ncbi:MAG: family acetyltransferase [Bacilli bacterium]|nr:family acetyltransferase [Bacilli bacterium]
MHQFRNMIIEDYGKSFELWSNTEGMALSEADPEQSINFYLNRNQGLSFVCGNERDGILIYSKNT